MYELFGKIIITDGGAGEGDSSSAGSGLPADAVSAQLINNITMLDYHSLGKTTTLIHDSVIIYFKQIELLLSIAAF